MRTLLSYLSFLSYAKKREICGERVGDYERNERNPFGTSYERNEINERSRCGSSSTRTEARLAPLASLSPPPPVPSGGTVESPCSAAEVDRQRTGLPRPAGGWGGSERDALRTAAGSAVGTPAGQPDPPEAVPGCHRRLGRGLVTPRLLVSHSGSASRGDFPRDFPFGGGPA